MTIFKRSKVIFIGVVSGCLTQCSSPKPVKQDPLAGLVLRSDEHQFPSKTTIMGPKNIPFGLYNSKGELVYDRIKILAQTKTSKEADYIKAKNGWVFTRIADADSLEYEGKKHRFILYTKQKEFFGTQIFSIRKENFELDRTAVFSDYPQLYRNYKITTVEEENPILIIEQFKSYYHARRFVRLIGFDARLNRQFSKTFYDYSTSTLFRYNKLKFIVISNSINSIAHSPSFQLFVFDKQNQLINELHATNNASQIESMKVVNGKLIVKVRVQQGCTICTGDFFWYNLIVDKNGKQYQLDVDRANKNYRFFQSNKQKELVEKPKFSCALEP